MTLSGAGISWAPVLIALFVSLGVVGVALFVLAVRRRRSAESPATA